MVRGTGPTRVTPCASPPLDGTTVVDASTTFSGPTCTQILAALGAEVIKVETPSTGDISRNNGVTVVPGLASIYLALNRGKKSIVVNLKDTRGRDLVGRLADEADVFLHNMRRPAAVRLGIDAATLRQDRPGLIHCEISGFGSHGPYAGMPAYDDVIQGMSGMAHLQALLTPGRLPTYAATSIADKVAGYTAAIAILAALTSKRVTGLGDAIEVPMYETLVNFVMAEHWGGLTFEPPTGQPVYPRMVAANRRPFETADGYVCVVIYTQSQWERFFAHIGSADLLTDARFATFERRNENINELYAIIAETLRRKSTKAWLDDFRRLDIPAMRVMDPWSLVEDEHLSEVGFFETLDYPNGMSVRHVRSPMLFTEGKLRRLGTAPLLNEHAVEIANRLNYTTREFEVLVAEGVVGTANPDDGRDASPD